MASLHPALNACWLVHFLQGCPSLTYPPRSLHAALHATFLSGATHTRAWHDKLALVTYYVLDIGLSTPPQAFWCACHSYKM